LKPFNQIAADPPEDAEDTTQAYAELNVVEPKNAYLVGIIKANPSVFKEVMLMSTEAWDIIVTTIEESDWFKERDKEKFKERDLETARKMKLENIPLDMILKITPLTRQEVEAL